jgi:L-arabinonolactonase
MPWEVQRMKAEAVVKCGNSHGEGVFWSARHGLLYWTDIFGERVWTYDPVTQVSRDHKTPGRVCCFATRKDRPWNEVVAAFSDGFAFLDLATGLRTDIAAVEAGLPNTRLNDGRTDRQGRLIAGGIDETGRGPGSAVYRLDPDLSVTKLFGDVGCANGTCFSADGRTMWYADSFRGDIERFDYDPSLGTVSNRRAIGRTPSPGVPDGSCIDAEGHVWNAVWEGSRVERWSPDGRIIAVIEVSVKKPTCVAFGGPRLDTLYITSSRMGESPEALERQPLAGHLFAVRPGVTGLADADFAA